MGHDSKSREAADRKRLINIRGSGKKLKSGGYTSCTLIVPPWLQREITGEDDSGKIWEKLQGYQFRVRKTKAGIEYVAMKVTEVEGW